MYLCARSLTKPHLLSSLQYRLGRSIFANIAFIDFQIVGLFRVTHFRQQRERAVAVLLKTSCWMLSFKSAFSCRKHGEIAFVRLFVWHSLVYCTVLVTIGWGWRRGQTTSEYVPLPMTLYVVFFVQTYESRKGDVLSIPLCPILPSYSPIYVNILRDQCRLVCTPAYVVVTSYERRLIRERIGVKTCTKDSTLLVKYR